MAQAVGAHSSYDEPIGTGGNREDLSDILFDVSPTETPILTAMKKNMATATNHEWLTDELADAADNAHVEGDDATGVVGPASRIRLGNYAQIFKKHAVVTGTQEKVLKGGGVKSEMAYQTARRLQEIKNDCERAMVGVNSAKVAGDDSTARRLGSLTTYLSGDSFQSGDGTGPAGNGADTPVDGTPRAFDEAILKSGLETLWNQSGGNENIIALAGSFNRGAISTFTASSTRYVTTDDKRLVSSIDVYDGDFHTVTVTPDRFSLKGNVLLIDPEYLACSELRPAQTTDLAKLGDSTRKEIVWEVTLEVCNPKAHVNIAGLTTS